MNGVIWNKMQGTFVPISSIPVYAMMQRERFRQSRKQETQNLQLQNLTLTSFQEKHFLEFYDNDTKVTGLCGDLWNLLSQSLNFTLQPVRSNESTLGVLEDDIYQNGLLSIIFRNETTIIPKVETYSKRLLAADFSVPLWMNSYRLYIHQEGIHDITWMTKVFSWKIWCFILVTYVLLSVFSFYSQIAAARLKDKCKSVTFGEHFFYNFGMLKITCHEFTWAVYLPHPLIHPSVCFLLT